MTPLPYDSSQGEAAALISVDPRGRIRLQGRPPDVPLFAEHHTLPQVEIPDGGNGAQALKDAFSLDGPLTEVGQWSAPPFTPHRRQVLGFIHHAGAPHPPGTSLSPEGLCQAFERSEILTDGPTLHLARVGGVQHLEPGAASIGRLTEALTLGPHPVAPGIDLLPLRTPTIPPATHTNCYILGDESLILIDPASPFPEEQARLHAHLKGRSGRVTAIVLTHHHGDHVGGANACRRAFDCPVLAHPITKGLLKGRVEIDDTLEEGDVLPLPGPHRFRAIFTPGHAQGHLCFMDDHTGALIAGDMVAGWGSIIVDYQEGNMAQYIHHLERLDALDPRVVCPAHGPPSPRGAGLLSQYIAHRLRREAQVMTALAQGPLTPKALIDAVYEGLPPFLRPAAESSLIAHLIKLEGEERVRSTLDGRFQHQP